MHTSKTAEPPLGRDALAEKELTSKRAHCIAESGGGKDEADLGKREHPEQGEEGHGHQRDAHPHPAKQEGAAHHAGDGVGAKVGDLADAFHGARDAQLAAGADENNQNVENGLGHHE